MNWNEEYRKCIISPYYFATNFLAIGTKDGKAIKFTTHLTEEQFNNQFKKNELERNTRPGSSDRKL